MAYQLVEKLEELVQGCMPWRNNVAALQLERLLDLVQPCLRLPLEAEGVKPTRPRRPSEQQQQLYRIHRLKEWLGISTENEVYDFAHIDQAIGCGLIATQDIKENQLILKVPRKYMLTTLNVQHQGLMQDPLLSMFPTALLAMALLIERHSGPSSFYKPYIDMLPVRFDIPLYFDKSEMKQLEGSFTYHKAIQCIYNTTKQFCYLYRLLEKLQDSPIPLSYFTVEKYFWAMAVVLSRQNLVPQSPFSEKKILALIPGWDMCNHENGVHSTIFNHEDDSLHCLSMRLFKQGEEVRMFYGQRGNIDLLVYAGFVLATNPYDVISLPIELKRSDPLFKIRTMIMSRMNVSITNEEEDSIIITIHLTAGGVLSPEARKAILLLNMDKHRLSEYLRLQQNQDFKVESMFNNSDQVFFLNECQKQLKLLTDKGENEFYSKRSKLIDCVLKSERKILKINILKNNLER